MNVVSSVFSLFSAGFFLNVFQGPQKFKIVMGVNNM